MDDRLAFSTFSDVEPSEIVPLAAVVEEEPEWFKLPGVSLHISTFIYSVPNNRLYFHVLRLSLYDL